MTMIVIIIIVFVLPV